MSSKESNPWPCNPQASDLVLHLANNSSGLVFSGCSRALEKWLSGGLYAQGPSGHLSWDLGWTRSTPCAPFAQTAASHGLDCSTVVPVPTWLFCFFVSWSKYLDPFPCQRQKHLTSSPKIIQMKEPRLGSWCGINCHWCLGLQLFGWYFR